MPDGNTDLHEVRGGNYVFGRSLLMKKCLLSSASHETEAKEQCSEATAFRKLTRGLC